MGDSNEEKVTCYGAKYRESPMDGTEPGLKNWKLEYIKQYSTAYFFQEQLFATIEQRNLDNGLLML